MTDIGATTTDLAAWLLERLAEDATAARAAYSHLVEHAEDFNDEENSPGDWRGSWQAFGRAASTEPSGRPVTSHIDRWDPARVLAECDAKRRIIDEHVCPCPDPNCGDCNACSGDHHADPTPSPCRTLKLLALPYADRNGYREDWRP